MAKAKRGRPRKRPPPEAYYVIEVAGWEWRYWINEARHSFDMTAVVENRDIIIHGTVRGPKLGKVTKAEVHLEPGWKLEEVKQPRDGEEILIGSIWMTTGVFQAMQRITNEAAASILQMLIADKIRFACVTTTPLHYRTGEIRRLTLQMDLADDEDVEP
ncbi:hypothetical protein [Aureimonas phyllosphaerae]|uniref:Uncharacterized protein n=1 Tax=Aureimonas phyllosphaerae TaxID=1166078 RepID=A0A7W6FT79_9HYPH|nr:hypothetical protein [Aureimonas phyllosphaerae]MBB3934889.1 hypothetical protein [Aureimonas phyllosphaerae]MBB3958897.1 hypothetical protein [Aureimonas phyllosphaerae]SFF40966.1 hypothetical protein SAMN05216566_111131 [Aureimonas phyllosphaerae]